MDSHLFDTPEYKRSRVSYAAWCTIDYFVTILVSDAYIAKLLTDLGISDSVAGIISSLSSVAFLFQIFSVLLANRVHNVKQTVAWLSLLNLLFFSALFLIPFLNLSVSAATVIVLVLIVLGYLFRNFFLSFEFKWANSFVQPNKLGRYSATKEMVSLISGIVFTLIVGFVLDRYESLDRLHAGFLFIAIVSTFLSFVCFVTLQLMAKGKSDGAEENLPLKETVKSLASNKGYICVVVLNCLNNLSSGFTVGFLGTFKTRDLLMTVGTVQLINVLGNLARFAVSRPFGKFSDRHSFVKGFELGTLIKTLGFAFCAFTTPKSAWCIIAYTVLYDISMAGTNQNSSNMVFSYVDPKCFSQAYAIKNCIAGLCAFGAALVSSALLETIQQNGNTFLGISVYGQQVLSVISVLFGVLTILYSRFVVSKQKPVER